MKRFVPMASLAILTLCALGAAEAAAAGKRAPRHQNINGNSMLSRNRMKQLKHGTHQIGNRNKHSVFANLKRGKVSNMHLKGPNGKIINGKRQHSRRRASLDTPQSDLHRVSYDCGCGWVFPIYLDGCWNNWYFYWPDDCVDGGDWWLMGDRGDDSQWSDRVATEERLLIDDRYRNLEV